MNRRNYTPQEDEVIAQFVQKHPQNITYALEQAANRLRRSYSGVSVRYYTWVRKNSRVLAVATPKGVVLGNTKNAPRKSALKEADKIELINEVFQSLSSSGKKIALRSFLKL